VLALDRIAVGRHLLLGGDNLDLAVARCLEALWGAELDAVRLAELVERCRLAKERLLSDEHLAEVEVQLIGRGTRLIGDALAGRLRREELVELIEEGFLPQAPLSPLPAAARGGLVEWGLPFEREVAVSRHLADFLCRAGGTKAARPDAMLFQGGFFQPALVRQRLATIAGQWFGQESLPMLASTDLARSVALGAAYFGLVQRGQGLRIGGGSARAYYVAVERGGQSRALCLAPRGMASGEAVQLSERGLKVRLGRPVSFTLYAAPHRHDAPGALLDPIAAELDLLPPVRATLAMRRFKGDHIAVDLEAMLSEVGTLELALVAERGGRRFELAFDLRAESTPLAPALPAVSALNKALPAAITEITAAFAGRDPSVLRGVPRRLESLLGAARRDWPLASLRGLWPGLAQAARHRQASAEHELRWLHLAGTCLRPGIGADGDPQRIRELWPEFQRGLAHQGGELGSAWYVLWRRVAAGLAAGQQHELAKPLLKELTSPNSRRGKQLLRGRSDELAEALRLGAALELIELEAKRRLADLVLALLAQNVVTPALAAWCLGRLGARVPFAPANHAVVPIDLALRWLEALMALPSTPEVAFALAQVARRTGDRARDLPLAARERVQSWLASDHPELAHTVAVIVAVDPLERARAFGEALPAGLILG
jgi:hypothetical protein